MIEVKLVADSINTATNDRLTTYLLTYPRYIHAEVMTHRVFSRNAASSRAIPVLKFRKDVMDNPVIPTHWGANQKGMQASDELDDVTPHMIWPAEEDIDGSMIGSTTLTDREFARRVWLRARNSMLKEHGNLEACGLHKQIANRILEPWFHIQLLVSATEFQNFFALRCHKDAHPDIQSVADGMLEAYMTSQPDPKNPGEWHLPFGDQDLAGVEGGIATIVKVCTARAARISYKTFEGRIDIEQDIILHDRLVASGHMSPAEHPAVALEHGVRSGNYRGWLQYRKTLPRENRTVDLQKLWEERKQLRELKKNGV